MLPVPEPHVKVEAHHGPDDEPEHAGHEEEDPGHTQSVSGVHVFLLQNLHASLPGKHDASRTAPEATEDGADGGEDESTGSIRDLLGTHVHWLGHHDSGGVSRGLHEWYSLLVGRGGPSVVATSRTPIAAGWGRHVVVGWLLGQRRLLLLTPSASSLRIAVHLCSFLFDCAAPTVEKNTLLACFAG